MRKSLYLECGSGISGDMFVASMIDLGADVDLLRKVLDSIPVTGFKYELSEVYKSGIRCCDFNVILEEDNHDHDMDYLHGDHEHSHNHDHKHSHDHSHEHSHSHDHAHSHSHSHVHRNLSDIYRIIDSTKMSFMANSLAKSIFEIIAIAESKAHGISIDNVHFHEVGAIDSIVDIIAAAVAFTSLNVDDVIIPGITEGTGTIRCAHGVLNVPVPAVVNIASENKLSLRITSNQGEFVTPTGAAIAAAIISSKKLPREFTILKTGLGAGKRNYELPSMLRSMIIEYDEEESDSIIKLESDVDDSTGEELGFVIDKLYDAGAREVHFTPIFMKKNRPGVQITVITDDSHYKELENIIFTHTTSIGVRRQRMERTILKRFKDTINTKYGVLEVKKVVLPDGTTRSYPEFESMKKLASENNVSIKEIKDAMLI